MSVKKHTAALQSLNTMTVGELRSLLSQYDDSIPVVFACSYGDRGDTQQALPITDCQEDRLLERSAYSLSGVAVVDEDDDSVELSEERPDSVLVLTA